MPPSLTSYITVVDPYRIKSPAENLETETPLPLGAQLLVVYVGKKTYNTLKKQTDKLQDFYQRGEEVITRFKKVIFNLIEKSVVSQFFDSIKPVFRMRSKPIKSR